jgi:hypothetical protein
MRARLLPWVATAVFGLIPWSATGAGEIYGTLTEGGRPVGEGVEVQAKCAGATYPPVKTDKSGSYHLAIKETGKCALTVKYKQQAPTLEVASYEDGVQVDLVLEHKDGKWVLRRK